jgi:ubiquinone/menaquinone biosynthesis C-methylase UbiE
MSSGPDQPVDAAGEPAGGWRAHMHYDPDSKRAKAAKIIELLRRHHALEGARVLEIGTGIGVISAELARAVGSAGSVISIDTMDTRVESTGYEFQLTAGVRLPFDDASFDVVVSNHVVEHVGDRADQQGHVEEIHRVLGVGGIGYLATPTRWAVIEPHFKLPLLSWPPPRVRDKYVALARRGKVYDVAPFGPREFRRSLETAGLIWRDVTMDALDVLVSTESRKGVAKLMTRAPGWLRSAARPAMPTMVYVVSPR